MSKISLEGNVSGSGTLTIAAPNTNSNFTLSLPTNTGTIITQNSTPAFASTIGVGGATAAASGAGITFPATQSASSDANTLDDYEEGTWTPSLGGNTTYVAQTGRYTKVGRLVTVTFDVEVSTLGTGSINIISGLPFASGSGLNNGMGGSVGYFSGLANTFVFVALRNDQGSSIINIATAASAVSILNANPTFFGNSARLLGALTYFSA
jgi:hypothetical protein